MGRDSGQPKGKALLDALMAEEGVTPLRARRSAERRRSAQPPPTAPRPGKPTRAASPPVVSPPKLSHSATTGEELIASRAHAAALEERVEALTAQLADTAIRLAASGAKLTASDAARDELDAERRSLHRRLSGELSQPVTGTSLAALLRGRGLREGEVEEALLGLLAERGAALAEILTIAAVPPVQRLLAEAIVLRCAAGDCAAPAGVVSLIVAPERCEVCGGSDVGRAFATFADACHAGGLSRVVLVGGSPSYRKQLQALYEPPRHDFSLELISGTSRKSERRVRGAARNADLVIIWASTLLDHATSNAYEAAGARTLTVPHRGIARMLRFVAESLKG